jgi:hypothetical protein
MGTDSVGTWYSAASRWSTTGAVDSVSPLVLRGARQRTDRLTEPKAKAARTPRCRGQLRNGEGNSRGGDIHYAIDPAARTHRDSRHKQRVFCDIFLASFQRYHRVLIIIEMIGKDWKS